MVCISLHPHFTSREIMTSHISSVGFRWSPHFQLCPQQVQRSYSQQPGYIQNHPGRKLRSKWVHLLTVEFCFFLTLPKKTSTYVGTYPYIPYVGNVWKVCNSKVPPAEGYVSSEGKFVQWPCAVKGTQLVGDRVL